MRYMARQVAENLYEVERSSGWWFWRKTWTAQAYWFDQEGHGSWMWVEDDTEVEDSDVRIALSEAHLQWVKKKEAKKWAKK